MKKENENLISIEEFIARAKRFGVDFGNGDPKNRLRYYVKIGLLSHAQRKSFNGLPPNGAYSESDLGILLEIDRKLKAGKSIQEIKREKEEEVFEKRLPRITTPYAYIYGPGSSIEFSQLPSPVYGTKVEKKTESSSTEELAVEETPGIIIERKPFVKIPAIFKIVFLVLICISIVFFANAKINFIDSISYFLADINKFRKLTQLSTPSLSEEVFILPAVEPYLTINAETAINAPLKVKEKITAPSFALIRDEFEGRIIVASLTAGREYNFPDLSGTVCLTTGNCLGLGGEVITPGGTANRLAKFISAQEVRDSSISDLYLGGVAITINSAGNVGIGIENPAYDLHVQGRIQATGDICTNLAGGRCLSTLRVGGGGGWVSVPAASEGIGGSGSANYLPIWSGAATLGNSILYQTGGNIGIGTTTPLATLTVVGSGFFQGPLTIATSTLGQLLLKYDDDNYLRFSINQDQAEILSSKTMLIDSLTGEVRLAGGVNLFNAAGAEVRGRTFISTTTDSTVRKSGEMVFRASIPIFIFPVPAQTTSTAFVVVSREISSSTLNATLPDTLPGATRKFAFLINFADDILTSASSTWLVDDEFYFAGQDLSILEEGIPHLSDFISPPENNWQLKVKVPSGNKIRIFNILLLAYDEIN